MVENWARPYPLMLSHLTLEKTEWEEYFVSPSTPRAWPPHTRQALGVEVYGVVQAKRPITAYDLE